jgi:hypothetical protein
MFECLVYLNLPLQEYPDVQIAKYEFDPGLQPGQKVNVTDLCWGFGEGESFSFEALVTLRKYQIEPQGKHQNDIFRVSIGLEMADKEQLPRLVEILEELNPGEIQRAIPCKS